jgi:hypothetical protein
MKVISQMTFSVEIDCKGGTLEGSQQVLALMDREALDGLIEDLISLRDKPLEDHFHYLSEEWGGYDLSNTPIIAGNQTVHHFKVMLLEDESR